MGSFQGVLARASGHAMRLSCLSLLAVALTTGCQRARAPAAIARLQLGTVITRPLAGGGRDLYDLVLAPGEYAEIEAEQDGINLALVLQDGGGAELSYVDGHNGNRGVEWLPVVGGGVQRVVVQPQRREAAPGGYTIRMTVHRPASAADDERVRAARLLARAEQLLEVASAQGFRQAGELCAQALSVWRRQGLSSQEAETVYNMGFAAGRLSGNHEEMIARSEEALTIYRRLGDKVSEGLLLARLPFPYLNAGRREHAFDLARAALPLCRETRDRLCEGEALLAIARYEGDTGRLQEGLEHHREAAEIFHAAGDRENEGIAVGNMGITSSLLGDQEAAGAYLRRAIELTPDPSMTRTNLSVRLARSRVRTQPQEALATLLESLRALTTMGHRPGQAAALKALGDAERQLGHLDAAERRYQQTVDLAREIHHPQYEANALEALGEVALQRRRFEPAAAALEQARLLMVKLEDRDGLSFAYEQLGLLEESRDHRERALALVREGIAVRESVRNQLLGEGRLLYGADPQTRRLYAREIAFLMRDPEHEGEHRQEAFLLSERLHGRALRETLADAGLLLPEWVAPELRARERALRDDVYALARARRSHPADQARSDEAEVGRKLAEYEALQLELARRYPQLASMTRDDVPSLGELQRQLGPRTSLVELSLGEETSYLWLVSERALVAQALPGREALETMARRVIAAVTARAEGGDVADVETRRRRIAAADSAFQAAAQELSNTIFGPIADRLGEDRLLIVADGALQYVPFAALPEPRPAGAAAPEAYAPLLQRHEVSELPSASVALLLRRQAARRAPPQKTLAVFADPVFDRHDHRVHPREPPLLSANDPESAAWPAREVEGAHTFARLISSRAEGEAIAALAPPTEVVAAFDFDATREQVLGGAVAHARIVHFATHGILDSTRPERSGLVLSLVDREGQPRDGYLRLADIYGLELDAHLVVLSACRTALGREVHGEGLIGLTRGFMQAGVPQVVASLWSVHDGATAELMQHFYHRLLVEHDAPLAALRAAQLGLLANQRWREPYYWAGFIIQGDWQWRPDPR